MQVSFHNQWSAGVKEEAEGAEGEVRTEVEKDEGGGGVRIGVGREWGGWLKGTGPSGHFLWPTRLKEADQERNKLHGAE